MIIIASYSDMKFSMWRSSSNSILLEGDTYSIAISLSYHQDRWERVALLSHTSQGLNLYVGSTSLQLIVTPSKNHSMEVIICDGSYLSERFSKIELFGEPANLWSVNNVNVDLVSHDNQRLKLQHQVFQDTRYAERLQLLHYV